MHNKGVQNQLCCRYRQYCIQNDNIDIEIYKIQVAKPTDIEKHIYKLGTHFKSILIHCAQCETISTISTLSIDSFTYVYRQIKIDTKVRPHQ